MWYSDQPTYRWLKQTGLEDPSLGHLKRIRKQDDRTTLLLCVDPVPPDLPSELELPDPFQVPVPSSAALTLTSLSLKTTFWPTFYAPKRKGETEPWSHGKVKWAQHAMGIVITESRKAQADGEVSLVSSPPKLRSQRAQTSIPSFQYPLSYLHATKTMEIGRRQLLETPELPLHIRCDMLYSTLYDRLQI